MEKLKKLKSLIRETVSKWFLLTSLLPRRSKDQTIFGSSNFVSLYHLVSSYHQRHLKRIKRTINNLVITSLLYFLVLTPIAVILKLLGRPFLQLKLSKQHSYWKAKKNNTNYEELY